ncbi:transcriptional repressor [Candidatus Fermentibacteria bacterium]|nr:transcriptional repressor [Candidatus Fermentibacteria bacterium]
MSSHPARRRTRQRQVILEELRSLGCHPTALTIYNAVRDRLPRVSLGTVYRNLHVLAEQGEIRVLESLGERTLFDHRTDDHLHVVCERCGKVADVDSGTISMPEALPDFVSGYEITGIRGGLVGICPECQNTSVSPRP